ncbi:DUF1543 domain-containing protein [Sphingomonas bisphenolicum]|uniref:DUF1543 domain-containing protein n=1 Tax=Sphingomonas bisphenolicum TaxID=296544 RepID=A0ABM7G6L9_9SPHN|nr:DUF1543 domain-containing protein [Sphingomonas bisphenolicum]BBF70960.1 hypothetical protein SBA_ch1_31600 [Sphingomonas bisphenolicum]
MKLFAIYVGGEFPGANIEIHDVRFVVANRIEETHAELRRQWWGIPKSLHIDCWAEITHADGYDVTLRPEPFTGMERLYFVNLGGYEPGEFAERHRNLFVVADSEPKAKSRALKSIRHWSDPHRDDLYEAEQAFCLSARSGDTGLHVHLIPCSQPHGPNFVCQYIPIRKNS